MITRTTLRFYLTILFLFNTLCGVAQQQQPLHFVAMHQVDHFVFVHTYKVEHEGITDQKDDQQVNALPSWITSMLNGLNAHQEIKESSFDAATGTFTIVTSTGASLQPIFDQINQ